MTPKEKKAFVARMKKGKKDAAKGKSKSKGGGKSATKPKRSDSYVRKKLRELGFSTRTINKYLRERGKMAGAPYLESELKRKRKR